MISANLMSAVGILSGPAVMTSSIVLQATTSGIDNTTFLVIVTGMGTAISAMAAALYKNERDRRIEAENKLKLYEASAPDVIKEVRRLAAEVRRGTQQPPRNLRSPADLPSPLGSRRQAHGADSRRRPP